MRFTVIFTLVLLGLVGVNGQTVTTLMGRTSTSGFADGVGTNALFNYPNGIAVDSNAKAAYIVDSDNQNIRVADLPSLTVTTLVGSAAPPTPGSSDGMGSACQFNNPNGIAIDTTRGILFVADMNNNLIRSVAIAPRVCGTLAGGQGVSPPRSGASDGVGTNALFRGPAAIAVDTSAGVLYITDTNNFKVRVLTLSTFAVTTLVGGGGDGQTKGYADGFGTAALFGLPFGVALCAPGLLCVCDPSYGLIRTVTLATAQANTLAGQIGGGSGGGDADGVGTYATFNIPFGILAWQGTDILVTDSFAVRRVNLATHTVTTLAGSGTQGSSDGTGTAASFSAPQGISVYTPPQGGGGGSNPLVLIVDAGIFVVRGLSLNASMGSAGKPLLPPPLERLS